METGNTKLQYTLYVRDMTQAVIRSALTTDTQVRSQASPCRIRGGRNGTGIGFSPSVSDLPHQERSINS
jgi:hypothetical protein